MPGTLCDHSWIGASYGIPTLNSVLKLTILICYGSAASLLAISRGKRATGSHSTALIGVMSGVLGLLMHTYLLYAASLGEVGLQLSFGNTISLVGSLIALVALIGSARTEFTGLAALLLPFAALSALTTGLGEGRSIAHLGWPMQAHIVLSVVAYSLLTIAALLAGLIAIQDKRLRTRHPFGLLRLLPPLESMEGLLFTTIGAGFGLLSLAIFSGLIFVDNMFAQHLVHKTVLSLIAWLIFGVLLFGRTKFGWRGRKAIRWTLGGFAVLALAYFGSRLVLEFVLNRHWG